jgi:multicomponent Na+:H+ antiporter subunit D
VPPSELAAVLSVALPLAGAMACLLAGRWAPVVALAAAAGLAAAATALALGVATNGPLRIPIGGWEPPLGIALAPDGLSAVFVATAALVMGMVLVAARPFFGAADGERRAAFAFWPLALFLWAALNGVFLSSDLFNLYVALELLTLSAIALVAIEGKADTLAAAIRYGLFALFGSLAYLLGAVLLYAGHGTLDMALLAARPTEAPADLVAGALMTAGLAAKTALFPFHAWLPPAHSGAPAPASALLSGLVPKASFFILLRIWFDVMPDAAGGPLASMLGALGAAAILYGSAMALAQERLKLVVAYSTVAQLGYLFLVFPLAGASGDPQPWSAGAWSGGVFHAISHASAKAAMFLCTGLFIQGLGHDRIEGLVGVARTMPMATFAFGLAAVTLMGLPPSGGFTAKYLMLTAAFASGGVLWGIVIVLGGLLAALYLFRPLTRAFEAEAAALRAPVPRSRQAAPLALALAAIALGFASAHPYALLQIGRPEAAEEGLE